jgi:hypothetical protein
MGVGTYTAPAVSDLPKDGHEFIKSVKNKFGKSQQNCLSLKLGFLLLKDLYFFWAILKN